MPISVSKLCHRLCYGDLAKRSVSRTSNHQSSITDSFSVHLVASVATTAIVPADLATPLLNDDSMTKPHPLLRGQEQPRAENSSGFSRRLDAKHRSFADKMWDPMAPDKTHRIAQPPLTTSRAELRQTKLRNPRVLRDLVRVGCSATRQNPSPPQVRQTIRQAGENECSAIVSIPSNPQPRSPPPTSLQRIKQIAPRIRPQHRWLRMFVSRHRRIRELVDERLVLGKNHPVRRVNCLRIVPLRLNPHRLEPIPLRQARGRPARDRHTDS